MTSADPQLAVAGCADEQRWHEALLEAPVCEPQLRLWTYRTRVWCSVVPRRRCWPRRARSRRPHTEMVLRRSGGGAVLTGPWMLSTDPAAGTTACSPAAVTSYRWLGALIAGLLRDMGVAAHACRLARRRASHRTIRRSLEPASRPVGEWWRTGEKIVGLAQLRRRTVCCWPRAPLLARPRLGNPVRWSIGRRRTMPAHWPG